MSRITTVIFDVYETLAYNNNGLWIDTFKKICHDQGLEIDPQHLYREWKELEVAFRNQRLNLDEPEKSPPFKSYEEAWRDCFVEVFSKLDLQGNAASAARETIVDMGERDPYPDAVEAIPKIQARWRTGILSNADDDYLFPLLKNIGWEFEAVLSSEGVRAYKPLPSPFWHILEKLNVRPEEAIYVGDTPYDDVLGAKGVGMRAVWINRHGASIGPLEVTPDYEVKSLNELPEILQREG